MATNSSSYYSIVVTGGMNTKIHHPTWYRFTEIFSPEEESEAIRNDQTLFLPGVSQITMPDFRIVCQEERWEIKTKNHRMLSRIEEIAVTLFDEKLPHTPVVACGLNFVYVRDVQMAADQLLALLVSYCPIDLGTSITSAELHMKSDGDNHSKSFQLLPHSDTSIRFATNFHYPQQHQKGTFRLAPIIGECKTREEESEARLNRLITQLKALRHANNDSTATSQE